MVLFEYFVDFVILTNLAEHRLLLIVVTVHLNIVNYVLKQHSSATESSHGIGHVYVRKMDVQVVKGRVVMEQSLDLSSWKLESFLNCLQRVITDRS